MNSTTTDSMRLDDFLRMGDAASEIRRIEEAAGEQLDIDKKREKIKKDLIEAARVRGETLTDAQASAAIERFYSRAYAFTAPSANKVSVAAATIYVHRTKIAKGVGIPTAIAITLGAVVWGGASLVESARKASLEREVESRYEQRFRDEKELEQQLQEVTAGSPFAEQLPLSESERFSADLGTAKDRLAAADQIIKGYCAEGSAKKLVTQENMATAQNVIPTVDLDLSEAKNQINDARGIVDAQRRLLSTRKSLDSLIAEIKALKPIKPFEDRAEATYAAALAAEGKRSLPEVENYQQQLVSIRADISAFSELTTKSERMYEEVRTIAKEDAAKVQAEKLHEEIKSAKNLVDVPRLRTLTSQLESLDATLNAEYTIKIVSKPGVKSGIDRYYTDASGKRASGFYLIVEAIDQNGRVIPRDIRNEEDGRVEKVTMWGERVSNEIYERVKKDKMDNGRVDNDVVGKKERGYLNERMIMSGVAKEGEITHW